MTTTHFNILLHNSSICFVWGFGATGKQIPGAVLSFAMTTLWIWISFTRYGKVLHIPGDQNFCTPLINLPHNVCSFVQLTKDRNDVYQINKLLAKWTVCFCEFILHADISIPGRAAAGGPWSWRSAAPDWPLWWPRQTGHTACVDSSTCWCPASLGSTMSPLWDAERGTQSRYSI